MRILVTGGCGFVGRNLTKRLIQEGHEVTITANGIEPIPTGVKKVLYVSLEGIDWDYVQGQDIIFHQMANNDTLCTDINEMYRANVNGPVELFRRAMQSGCRRFVYASSTAVYGNSPAPYDEDATPLSPLNPYAKSKFAFEKFATAFNQSGIVVIGFRYCNVYGPGEEQKGRRMSMVGQILRKMLRGEQPELFAPGEQLRDWVYVNDVVNANILAMQSNQSGIYNIGSGQAWTFNDIVTIINDLTGQDIFPKYKSCPFPEQYQNYTECKIEKVRTCLTFSPKFDLRSGVETYLKYLTSF